MPLPTQVTSLLDYNSSVKYITEYYHRVIDNPRDLIRLVKIAVNVVERNINEYGPQTAARLHWTLEEILDNFKSKKNISLESSSTDSGLALGNSIEYKEQGGSMDPSLRKGRALAHFFGHFPAVVVPKTPNS